MRIGIARIWQETNTFSPEKTTLERFELFGLYSGREVLAHIDQLAELEGAVAAAKAEGNDIELVPIFAAGAWPAGRLTKETAEHLKKSFLNSLDECGQLDGMFLSLHGALASEDCDDFEGELLEKLRKKYGQNLPIVVSLDMHANITSKMVSLANAIVGYHTCPHLDVEETGQRAMEILLDILTGKIAPVIAWRKLPMVVPADRHNHLEGPLKKLIGLIEKIEEKPEVVSCSVFAVQPWLDVEELGWSTVVITDGKPELSQDLADEIAEKCWQNKDKFIVDKVLPTEAINKAIKIQGSPVVISDSADSTNSGASGNSTWLLKEIIKAGLSETIFLTMVAPEVAENAHKAGVGADIDAEFGVIPENPFNQSLKIRMKVKSLHEGTIRLSGHLGRNLVIKMGKTAVLESDGIKIVVSQSAGPGHVPPEFFSQLGLDVNDAKIIIAKSPVGFRAAYEAIAAGIILCEAPGPACSDLSNLNFKKRPVPMYPFENDLEWSALNLKEAK